MYTTLHSKPLSGPHVLGLHMYLTGTWAKKTSTALFNFFLGLYFTCFTRGKICYLYNHQNSVCVRVKLGSFQLVHTHTLIVYTEVHTSTCVHITYISHTCTHTSLTSVAGKNKLDVGYDCLSLQCATDILFLTFNTVLPMRA